MTKKLLLKELKINNNKYDNLLMTNFIRKSQDEIHKMSVDEFCEYMDEWDKASEEKWSSHTLTEAEIPQFKTKEEARKYFGAISFDDFEQKYLK